MLSCAASRRRRGKVRPWTRRNDGRGLDVTTQRIVCPQFGLSIRLSDISHILDEKTSSVSNPACAVGALAFEVLHARTRRSSQSRGSGVRVLVGDGSLRSARTRRSRDLGRRPIPAAHPVPVLRGRARGPRILVPSSLVVTSAALTPSSLRLESDQEGRWPSSLTRPSAQFGIRDAPPGHTSRGETLQRYRPGRLVPNADSRL